MTNEFSQHVKDAAILELVAKYFDRVDEEKNDPDHYVQYQLRRIALRIEALGEAWV